MFNGGKSKIQRLSPHEKLRRHRHAYPYAALVLTGRYLEAGDRGRRWIEPGQVRANSPAAPAGVLSGDKIVAVDRELATSLSYQEVYEIVRRPPGTHLRIELLRTGQSITVDVELRDPH